VLPELEDATLVDVPPEVVPELLDEVVVSSPPQAASTSALITRREA